MGDISVGMVDDRTPNFRPDLALRFLNESKTMAKDGPKYSP